MKLSGVSKDGFRSYLRPFIEKSIPFMAYWHPAGMGLIRLDEVRIPTIPACDWHGAGPVPTKRKRVTKTGLRMWEKNLAKLRKQTWGEVITVEFDGKETKIEGGEITL